MKKLIEKILPMDDKRRKLAAVGLTVLVSGILTLWGIYGIGQYGIALFILTPLFIGVSSTVLYGFKKEISKSESWLIGQLTLFVFVLGLVVFAIEGLICIGMATPFAMLLVSIGSSIGYKILNKLPNDAPTTLLIFILVVPTTAFIEQADKPILTSVVTSIEIDAPPHTV